jgi:hypothetical protein
VCCSWPLLTVQPSQLAPHSFIKACTSSALLVRNDDTYPSNTRTNGIIGIIYVKKRCPGDLQKWNGVMRNIKSPIATIVIRDENVLSWSSKILDKVISLVKRRIEG